MTRSALAIALLMASPAALAADTFDVDPGHTSVLFSVHHLGAAWVYGRFTDTSGSFTWDNDDPSAIKLDVTIKSGSVVTHNEKRDKHLNSPDFFDTQTHPAITFKSTSVKKSGERYAVTGDLTLHGVTKQETILLDHTGEGSDPWGGYRLGLHSTFEVARSDYGITTMPDGLSDTVKMIVSIEGTKQK